MRNRAKGTGRFAFKESKEVLQLNPKKPCLLYLWFTYGKNRFKLSTGYKIAWEDWDPIKERVKNRVHILDRDKINQDLNNLMSKAEVVYSDSLRNGELITSKDFKFRITNEGHSQSNLDLGFFDVVEKYLEYKNGTIKDVTLRSYKQTLKLLRDFDSCSTKSLSFDNVDRGFYKNFKSFLEEHEYSLNTIGKHIKNLKTFCNYALTEGYTQNRKFKRPDFKSLAEQTTEVFLSEAELDKIFKLDLSENKDHALARDVFLMGCYMGQRISDYNGLSKDQIIDLDGIEYFKIRQQKNFHKNKVVHCPITKSMRTIMSRYDNSPPPYIHEQDLNDAIKEICRIAGLTELVVCGSTVGGTYSESLVPKYKLVKAHTARRSFCTNMYLKGMPTYDIMLFSGHSTEKEFYKYIRIEREQRAHALVNSGKYFMI